MLIVIMPSVIMLSDINAECLYAEVVMPNGILLSGIILNAIVLSGIMPSIGFRANTIFCPLLHELPSLMQSLQNALIYQKCTTLFKVGY